MGKSKAKNKFWAFRNSAEDGVGELSIYGDIADFSWWGDEVAPKQFREDLDALGDISVLKVFINSGGGDVFAGQAILSMLKRHKAKVEVYIDGLAASAASVIAMAGDVVRMPRNAMMMIHNAWVMWVSGNAEELRKLADTLDKINESIIAAYRDKTGLPDDEIKALMDAETWFTAEEALEKGFIDEVEEAQYVAASIRGKDLFINGQVVSLERYRNPPPIDKVEPKPQDDQAPDLEARKRKLALEIELL